MLTTHQGSGEAFRIVLNKKELKTLVPFALYTLGRINGIFSFESIANPSDLIKLYQK